MNAMGTAPQSRSSLANLPSRSTSNINLAATPSLPTKPILPAIRTAHGHPLDISPLPEWMQKTKQALMASPEWPALRANLTAKLQRAALLLDENRMLRNSQWTTEHPEMAVQQQLLRGFQMQQRKVAQSESARSMEDPRQVRFRKNLTQSRPGTAQTSADSTDPTASLQGGSRDRQDSAATAGKRRQLTDLDKEELLDLLEQVELEMAPNSTLYQRLHQRCTELVDERVYEQAVKMNRQSNNNNSNDNNNSPQSLTVLEGDAIAKASYALTNHRNFRQLFLHWPDMRRTFVTLVNTHVTMPLRKVLWFACLQDAKCGADFERFVTTQRLEKILKSHGSRFYAQSQTVLSQYDDFEFIRTTPPLMLCMKHVVLYLYEQQNNLDVKELLKTLCHVVVPFIYVYQEDIKLTDIRDLSGGAASMIAQMATSLLKVFQTTIYGGTVLRDELFVVFDGLLREKNPDLQEVLFKLNNGEQTSSCLSVLMDLLTRYVFVDIVTLDTVLFLWDQLILGTNELCRHSQLPPFALVLCWICCIHSCLLQEPLSSCKVDREVEAITMSHSRFLLGQDYVKELSVYYTPFLKVLGPTVAGRRPSENPLENAEAHLLNDDAGAKGETTEMPANAAPRVTVPNPNELTKNAPNSPNEPSPSDEIPAFGRTSPLPPGLQQIQEGEQEGPYARNLPTTPLMEILQPQSLLGLTQSILWKIDAMFGKDPYAPELIQARKAEADQRARMLDEDMREVEQMQFGRELSMEERQNRPPAAQAEFMKKLDAYRKKKYKNKKGVSPGPELGSGMPPGGFPPPSGFIPEPNYQQQQAYMMDGNSPPQAGPTMDGNAPPQPGQQTAAIQGNVPTQQPNSPQPVPPRETNAPPQAGQQSMSVTQPQPGIAAPAQPLPVPIAETSPPAAAATSVEAKIPAGQETQQAMLSDPMIMQPQEEQMPPPMWKLPELPIEALLFPATVPDLTRSILWKIDSIFGMDPYAPDLLMGRKAEAEERAIMLEMDRIELESKLYGHELSPEERENATPAAQQEFMKKLDAYRKKKYQPNGK